MILVFIIIWLVIGGALFTYDMHLEEVFTGCISVVGDWLDWLCTMCWIIIWPALLIIMIYYYKTKGWQSG